MNGEISFFHENRAENDMKPPVFSDAEVGFHNILIMSLLKKRGQMWYSVRDFISLYPQVWDC